MDIENRPLRRDPGDVLLDGLLAAAGRALKSLLAPTGAARPLPAPARERADEPAGSGPPGASRVTPSAAAAPLPEAARREAAALMRVNHAGEVAAQALYHGQALVARQGRTREFLLEAAREEADHLAWCESRLSALGSRPSLLNPLWYAGSFAIGAFAAAFGDRASLGFVAETERQVEGHIDGHLARLPPEDRHSRAVLEAMRRDEIGHGSKALQEGAAPLPRPVREAMRATARIMTRTSYWI
jgi:ubiquinone biosynthesis monooxygenase Coq7